MTTASSPLATALSDSYLLGRELGRSGMATNWRWFVPARALCALAASA